jgi:hypothetical protein
MMRWAGHVAHLERKEECRQEFSGKPEEKRQLEYLGVNLNNPETSETKHLIKDLHNAEGLVSHPYRCKTLQLADWTRLSGDVSSCLGV